MDGSQAQPGPFVENHSQPMCRRSGLAYGAHDMTRRLDMPVDEELARKLDALRDLTGQTTGELVRAALELYYDRVRQGAGAYRQLEDVGFIGCAEGPEDLSENYKAALSDPG